MLHVLRLTEEHHLEPSVLEVGSRGTTADRIGVGSSPSPDLGYPATLVPAARPADSSRFLVCCALHWVRPGEKSILFGIRQRLTIGCLLVVSSAPGEIPSTQAVDVPVTGEWSFADGNVSWHLRWIDNPIAAQDIPPIADPLAPVGSSPNPYASGSLLYVPPFAPYVAPWNGKPPGEPILDLGTFYDVRYPSVSHGAENDLYWECPGGGAIALYASVLQTDPATRPLATIPAAALPYVRREDAFVQTIQGAGQTLNNAVYRYVGGSLILQTDAIGKNPCRRRPEHVR